MKDWPPAVKATVSYVEATEENMKYVEDEGCVQNKKSWSFWRFLFRRKQHAPGELVWHWQQCSVWVFCILYWPYGNFPPEGGDWATEPAMTELHYPALVSIIFGYALCAQNNEVSCLS